MSVTPFVVGQWVRAERFYGRTPLIDEILHGHRDWLWLLGTRRIGKTSLLKQVEHLTQSGDDGYFPLFWDLQGSSEPRELHFGFHDSLLDAEAGLKGLGILIERIEDEDLFASLSKLRRQLRLHQRKLLLLCDEVEELIKLNELNPHLLGKLRRAFQSPEDIRTIMASTIRLWALADQYSDTSPFLNGFTPPLYIRNLSDGDAQALILQSNLPDTFRPKFNDQIVERIRTHCDNHPYLIQLLCKKCLELEDLDDAIDQVASDPMVSHFFSVDFNMLSENEQKILSFIADQDSSTSNSIQGKISTDSTMLGANLHRLEHLGYIHRDADRRYRLSNSFFRTWFCARKEPPAKRKAPEPIGAPSVETMSSTLSIGSLPRVIDNRYELLDRAGAGGQGVVYKAEDRLLRTTVAVKVLREEYLFNEEAMDRARREIVLARDIAHPNVVRIYHLGESNGRVYMIMQWIDGRTLSNLISQNGPLPCAWAKQIAERLAGALEAAHSRKILHRDIKASNILMDSAGEPHLSDFGLAKLLEAAGATSQGLFLGTPDYSSPEQANNEPLDERSDIYSLGVVMFEMLTGRKPFVAGSMGEVLELHRRAVPPDPGSLRPEVPRAFSRLILSCLEKDRFKRPQRAGDLRLALGNL
jgi:serine/threonine protein kinase